MSVPYTPQAKADPYGSVGKSPLQMAAEHGHLEVARLLLEAKADLNESGDGRSPLQIACERGHVKVRHGETPEGSEGQVLGSGLANSWDMWFRQAK